MLKTENFHTAKTLTQSKKVDNLSGIRDLIAREKVKDFIIQLIVIVLITSLVTISFLTDFSLSRELFVSGAIIFMVMILRQSEANRSK